jgi:hypothetical protein
MPYGMVDTQSDEGKEKNNTVNKKDGITMRHNASGGGGLGGVACRPVARGGAGGSRLAPRGRRATVCGARRRGLRCPWRRAAGHGHLDEPHAGGQLPEHEAPLVRLPPPPPPVGSCSIASRTRPDAYMLLTAPAPSPSLAHPVVALNCSTMYCADDATCTDRTDHITLLSELMHGRRRRACARANG